MQKIKGTILVLGLSFLTATAWATEIDFIEDFALSTNREEAIKQLIPGTEDFYYYQCFDLQNRGEYDKVRATLKLWIDRYGHTPGVEEIRNRQALLDYEKDPKATLDFLKKKMELTFNHQREVAGQQTTYPTQLDQSVFSRETLKARALLNKGDLSDFEDSALEFLVYSGLTGDQRRDLLRRLQRPDYTNLVQLVNADLDYKDSQGFGAFNIHKQMLLSQLDELLKLRPKLIVEYNFIQIYISKLQPGPDVDWRHDAKAREAYLDTLWAFVQKLPPSQNSLKAHVLYQRLAHDRALGVYDRDRFMEYVKLPRNVSYMKPEYLQLPQNRDCQVNIQTDYRNVTQLPAICNDESLVRDYLMQFFVKDENYDAFSIYILDTYLKEIFAETKIQNGIGDMEKWYSLLNNPEKYREIKDRIEIEFSPANKTYFKVEEPVGLDVDVKNVKALIVKVFEINTMNYYREQMREVNTDIDLDGLVAGDEKSYTYNDPPMRRVRRHFDFPNLNRCGIFVVELIGNGKSSRALIRKGQFTFLERCGAAGQVFTILDENNRKLNDASIWLSGHEYKTDKDGSITIPYSTKPGPQEILISSGGFTVLDDFQQHGETYSLKAGIYVDRESLLKRAKAKVLVRPTLLLNGEPVSLSLIEEPTLLIRSTDIDNVQSTKEIKNFKLSPDAESVYEFQVPDKVITFNFVLNGRVASLSENTKVYLSDTQMYPLNTIDTSAMIEDLHLSRVPAGYVLRLLGKSGEKRPACPVTLSIKHRNFKEIVDAVVQTDAEGIVNLGNLQDVVHITAQIPEGRGRTWYIEQPDRHNIQKSVHGREGDKVLIAYMGKGNGAPASLFSLLEKRGDTYIADQIKAITLADGYVEIAGLRAGTYDLLVKENGMSIGINVVQGDARYGYALGNNRLLEIKNPAPLQIKEVTADEKEVHVLLKNATDFTRVHVTATRMRPEYEMFAELAGPDLLHPQVVTLTKKDSGYVSGRDIGDEYRYILDRKYAQKFPGNMLARPSLLLNPWTLRETDTEFDSVAMITAPVTMKGIYGGRSPGARGGGGGGFGGGAGGDLMYSSLDFLPAPSFVLANLRPDKNGLVVVPRKDLGDGQEIHVIAINPDNTAYRELVLPETKLVPKDLRLANGMDPAKHFTEQNQITTLAGGASLTLNDVTTSKIELYDTIGKIYRLYSTLSYDANLAKFGFIAEWPKLKPDEQREKYSKYACHELNFFLYRKDPKFFQSVVLPALKNKKDKTFMDHWLIGSDLKEYLKPWAYDQLNIVERILLAQRIKKEAPAAARHVKDLQDLIPPNLDWLNLLFLHAIEGSALETGGLGRTIVAAMKRSVPAGDDEDMVRSFRDAEPVARAVAAAPAEEKAEMVKEPSEVAVDVSFAADKAVDALRKKDEAKRGEVRQYYRVLDKTKEWAENNYYCLPIQLQGSNLVTVNAFWVDYAAHQGNGPFLSSNFAQASRNFTEMMLALAVMDLPFDAKEPVPAIENVRMTLTAGGSMVVFSREIKECAAEKGATPLLVSQNFFRASDRYRYENGERFDKYVADEFLTHVVYGCQVVLTDPTSSPMKLDVLLQIPNGAMPASRGFYTKTRPVQIGAYSTTTLEYYFYFPAAGDFKHYPIHVARNGKLIAFASPAAMKVVEAPTKQDTTSWDYVSQNGKPEEVLAFLDVDNPNRLNLDRIAWRMRDKDFFEKTTALLSKRHVYDETLWSYGIYNNVPSAIREYLLHDGDFLDQCGLYLDCKLVTNDPIVRQRYQHLEYSPLVNARVHQVGKRRQVLNNTMARQYYELLMVLGCKQKFDDADLMSVVYYLLLQDRVEEAQRFFGRVNPKQAAMQMQYDYLKAYLDFYTPDHKIARGIATKYRDYPVDRWRNLFLDVLAQLDEMEGKSAAVVDKQNREQVQGKLAATEASFDFSIDARKITMNSRNLAEARVNYYLMDVELLFSRNPFVQQGAGQFAHVQPNRSDVVKLPRDGKVATIDLPRELKNANVMVEITAGGISKSQPYFANSLAVQVIENYGQVRVANQKDTPLALVYIKVYARMKDGKVKFYKDGYTDQRGRFDYASLNTNELGEVEKLAILILSESEGAVIREANPPKQ